MQPVAAWGAGDPHYISLDGKDFSFNGEGHYALLDAENLRSEYWAKMLPLSWFMRNLVFANDRKCYT